MSSCGCNSTGLPIGPTGATGAQGLFGGFSAEWVFNTSTSTGPSSTQLRFNNSTYASVTEIYISDTGTGSLDMDAFLDSFSNGGKYGYIKIFKKSDSTKFWMGQVTAVVDNGTDHTLTVTYISANSTFAASDAVVTSFAPTGGSIVEVLYNETIPVSTSNAGYTTLMSYTLPINKLANDGDVLEITALLDTDEAYPLEWKTMTFNLNTSLAMVKRADMSMLSPIKYLGVQITITRQTSTTVLIEYQGITTTYNYVRTGGYAWFDSGVSVDDLSAYTLLIEIKGKNADAGTETIACNQLLVKYLNKI